MLISRKKSINPLLLLLQLLVPSAAFADDDCAYEAIGKVAKKLAFISLDDLRLTSQDEFNSALEKVQADEHALSCMRLLQRVKNQKLQNKADEEKVRNKNNAGNKDNVEKWSLIAENLSLTNRVLFDNCNSYALCKTSQTVVKLLSEFCLDSTMNRAMGINITAGECAKIKKQPIPLSSARRGIGWGLVAAGGVTIILGAIQMGVPLFSTDDGCVVAGLRHPCSADRFGVGGALLGSGLAVFGGGVLTLTLPARGQ